MSSKLIVASIAVTAAVVVGAVALARQGEAGGPPETAPKSTFSLAQAESFAGFPVFNAGEEVGGHPLTAVLRRTDGTTNYVSFIYGDCEATDDSGCAPPVEIQTWPACARNLAKYDDANLPTVPEERTVRGVPALSFSDGERLEIQVGTSTVVIFAGEARDTLTAARALRGVNTRVGPGGALPKPSPAVLAGRVRCD